MKKLMQVWRWYDYPVEQVIEWANKCGLDSLSIKFADGPNPYGKPNTSKEQKASDLLNYILALKNAGFEVGGWMWLYGFYPEKEASVVKWGFDELGLSFVQLNIEGNQSPDTAWKLANTAKEAGRRLMTEMWNLGLNGKEIHLNSHRFPAYFPQIPWDLFCKPQRWGWLQPLVNIVSHHAPQVIHAFKDDAAAELRESHEDLMAIYPLKFCAMGTAHEWYSGGTKWEPTVQDFQEFIIQANDLGCERVGWYKLEYLIEKNKQDWADAIRTTLHDPNEPDPQPNPEPTDCDAAIAAAVQAEQQRIIDFIKG